MQHRCDMGGGDHHFGDEDDESDAVSIGFHDFSPGVEGSRCI